MADDPIVLAWQGNASTGWGLYGLHLAIQLKRLGRRVYLAHAADLTGVPAPLHALLPQPTDALPDPAERVVVVSALGNSFDAPLTLGLPNPPFHVGLAVCEDTGLTDTHVANLKLYDRLITPSRWCQSILESHGVHSIVCHQGYDSVVFSPTPRTRPLLGSTPDDGRLLIFSGGKLEYRKGQDIAIAAFTRFRQTPEGQHAILVTAWHNAWPGTMEGIWNAGHVEGVPTVVNGQMQLGPWLALNGIPPEQHIDLGQLTQLEAAAAMRECDLGIFPNRCEGATNMVLTECAALGLPVIFGRWCGQADLMGGVTDTIAPALNPPSRMFRGTDGWREWDVNALVSMLITTVQFGLGRTYTDAPTWAEAGPDFSALLVAS